MKRRILWLLMVLIAAGALWFTYYNLTFRHLLLNDAMDYASIGRNFIRGDGFISSYITPLGLANHKGLPHPDLWRAPLWPMLLGVFIRLFGASDQTVAIATGSVFIAGAGLMFLLGEALFDRKIALMSALIYMLSAQNLVNSTSGMTETLSAFLMMLAVYVIVAPWAQNAWGDVAAGAVMGFFYLARYNALLFLPLFIVFTWYRRKSQKSRGFAAGHGSGGAGFVLTAVRFLAGFLIIVSPWLVRNFILMGSPMFSLQKYEPAMFTTVYPGYSLYMMMTKVNAAEFLMNHPQEIWGKVVTGWAAFRADLFNPAMTGVNKYLFWLFLASLVIPFNYRGPGQFRHRTVSYRHQGVRPLILLCFLGQLAALLVIHFIYRLFYVFVPFYIIFGSAALVWLVRELADRLQLKKGVFSLVTVAAVLVFIIGTNLPSFSPLAEDKMPITGLRDSVKAVTDLSTRKDLIISNDGHLLAWYGDRYAAKLPYSVDMIPEMEKLAPLKFIYLSSRISWNIPEADKSWGKLFWTRPQQIYDFRRVQVFPDGSVLYRKML